MLLQTITDTKTLWLKATIYHDVAGLLSSVVHAVETSVAIGPREILKGNAVKIAFFRLIICNISLLIIVRQPKNYSEQFTSK